MLNQFHAGTPPIARCWKNSWLMTFWQRLPSFVGWSITNVRSDYVEALCIFAPVAFIQSPVFIVKDRSNTEYVSMMCKVVLHRHKVDMTAMTDITQICWFDWTWHTVLTFGKDNWLFNNSCQAMINHREGSLYAAFFLRRRYTLCSSSEVKGCSLQLQLSEIKGFFC